MAKYNLSQLVGKSLTAGKPVVAYTTTEMHTVYKSFNTGDTVGVVDSDMQHPDGVYVSFYSIPNDITSQYYVVKADSGTFNELDLISQGALNEDQEAALNAEKDKAAGSSFFSPFTDSLRDIFKGIEPVLQYAAIGVAALVALYFLSKIFKSK